MREPTDIERTVATALRNACLKTFGTTWDNDVAWGFARAAIRAMDQPTLEMLDGGMDASGRYDDAEANIDVIWRAMLFAASPPDPSPERSA